MNENEPGISFRKGGLLIGMSGSFLRKSDCPRHRFIGNGPKRRPIVVVYASEVLAWWKAREIGTPMRKAG